MMDVELTMLVVNRVGESVDTICWIFLCICLLSWLSILLGFLAHCCFMPSFGLVLWALGMSRGAKSRETILEMSHLKTKSVAKSNVYVV